MQVANPLCVVAGTVEVTIEQEEELDCIPMNTGTLVLVDMVSNRAAAGQQIARPATAARCLKCNRVLTVYGQLNGVEAALNSNYDI